MMCRPPAPLAALPWLSNCPHWAGSSAEKGPADGGPAALPPPALEGALEDVNDDDAAESFIRLLSKRGSPTAPAPAPRE